MSVEFVEKKRWLFLGLPFTFTRYMIKEDMITVDTGVFTKVENDCYMYKVQDVEHTVEHILSRVAVYLFDIIVCQKACLGQIWCDDIGLSGKRLQYSVCSPFCWTTP